MNFAAILVVAWLEATAPGGLRVEHHVMQSEQHCLEAYDAFLEPWHSLPSQHGPVRWAKCMTLPVIGARV